MRHLTVGVGVGVGGVGGPRRLHLSPRKAPAR